jgi:hypothetical protein
MSAAVLVLLVAAYLAVNSVTARVWSGRLPFLTGCRQGYRIVLAASVAAWMIFISVLYPMTYLLTFSRFLGWYWPEFDNFVIGLFVFFAVVGLAGLLRDDPGLPVLEDVYLTGAVVTEREQQQLFLAIHQIAQSSNCAMPRNVVLGLDPAVIATARRVRVEGVVLTGGTLYLSLLYHRLLSEAELMALVTIALLPVQMVSEESENWLLTMRQRWQQRRRRFQQATIPAAGIPLILLWYWLDLWGNWQGSLGGFAIRQAAVKTGRENVAAALSKAAALSRRWPLFLREQQGNIRRSQVQAAQVNLSEMLVVRMTGLAGDLASEVVPNPWISGLGVGVDEVKRRVADLHPEDPPTWIADVETLEKELSMAQIKRMVFLREPVDSGPPAG